MKQYLFTELQDFGSVRDYRSIRSGDSILIPSHHQLLRRTSHARLELERKAMISHAHRIGAKVQNSLQQNHLIISFI